MDDNTAWTQARLDDAFRDVREDLSDLKHQIRVFAPVVPDVAALQQRANAVERSVDKMEVIVQNYVNRSVTRQLVIVSSPLFLTAIGILFAVLTHKV